MTTICESVDAVARAVSSAGWARIGIDGVDGSGKSSLAASLALQLGSAALDLDDFLNKNQEKMMANQPDFILQYARLLKEHYQQGKHQGSGKATIALILIILVIFLAATIYVSYIVLQWLFGLF